MSEEFCVKLHGFTAVASLQTGFRGAEPRTESHSSMSLRQWLSGAWVKKGRPCIGRPFTLYEISYYYQ